MTSGFHIEGRRWFSRPYGNTYHSVRIFRDGKLLVHLPFSYGYGDQYLYSAVNWLRENGHIPDEATYGSRYLRDELGGSYSVIDVSRKKDL